MKSGPERENARLNRTKSKVGILVNELRDLMEETLDGIEEEMEEIWNITRCRMEEIMGKVLVKMEKVLNEMGHEMNGEMDDKTVDGAYDETDDKMEICNIDVYD